MEEQHESVDERIDELLEAANDFDERCLFRSSQRVVGEVMRLAKREQRLYPFMRAAHFAMNTAQNTMEPELGREIAIECVAILGSDERARAIQPDFDEGEYQYLIQSMSSCAYDNLATHVATSQGYNSDGMHSCVTEGIEVCRRTGNPDCITCFREYSVEVYRAADDMEMALHFANRTRALSKDAPGSDRRWVAANQIPSLLLQQGQLREAIDAGIVALGMAEVHHRPFDAKLDSLVMLETLLLLAGETDRMSEIASVETAERCLPEGEYPNQDLKWSRRDALAHAVKGEYASAAEILTDWDRKLTQLNILDDWFDVRLQLIATYFAAGDTERAQSLVKGLEGRAAEAKDWLTVRRLKNLLRSVADPQQPVVPYPVAEPLNCGPFSVRQAAATTAEVDSLAEADSADADVEVSLSADDEIGLEEETETPLDAFVRDIYDRIDADDEEEDVVADQESVLDSILALPVAEVTHPMDAKRLIQAVRFCLEELRLREIWSWLEGLQGQFVADGTVISTLASLGGLMNDWSEENIVPPETIEALLRRSLELAPEDANCFGRAGVYFLRNGDFGEAERYLARGFRLNREQDQIALRLAEVYRETERPRDALEVLDMCLRAGADSPAVLWEAALGALNVGQYESVLTYLKKYEEYGFEEAWVHYYMAIALLELGRPDDALASLDVELQRAPEAEFIVRVLRCTARMKKGQAEEADAEMRYLLSKPLRDVDYMTETGLRKNFENLWEGNELLADAHRQKLQDLLLRAGLAPDDIFEAAREQNEVEAELMLYRCFVEQPLDETWAVAPGCLSGQESWNKMTVQWGALARDPEHAEEIVMAWHQPLFPMPATIEHMEVVDEGFRDSPGVTWQGYRWESGDEEGQ